MAIFRFMLRTGEYQPLVARMAVQRAPKGGITIGGKKFKGGEFIPGEVLANASAQEKAALANQSKKPNREMLKAVNALKLAPRGFRDERRIGKQITDAQFDQITAGLLPLLKEADPKENWQEELAFQVDLGTNDMLNPNRTRPAAIRAFAAINALLDLKGLSRKEFTQAIGGGRSIDQRSIIDRNNRISAEVMSKVRAIVME